jgi:hypothetical protein
MRTGESILKRGPICQCPAPSASPWRVRSARDLSSQARVQISEKIGHL